MANYSFMDNPIEWKDKLDQLDSNFGMLKYEDMMQMETSYQDNEVGLRHPKNGAGLVIRDDGTVYLFASDTTGICIDPKTGAVTAIAKTINQLSKVVNIKTEADGLRWNQKAINPEFLSRPRLAVEVSYPSGDHTHHKSIQFGKTPQTANKFSDEVIKSMKDLGLDTWEG